MKFALVFCTAALLLAALFVGNRSLTQGIDATSMDLRWLVLAIVVVPPVYFVPSIIAAAQDHPQAPWVFLLNLAFGWTIAGWVAALAWGVSASNKPPAPYRPLIRKPMAAKSASPQVVQLTPDIAARRIEELVAMKADGRISEAEYAESCRLVLAPLTGPASA